MDLNKKFQALLTREIDKNKFSRAIETRSISELPENDVLVKVEYSSLNYKDALSARGHKGISRRYPHTPGIDAAGVVEADASGKFQTGEQVLVTGYDLGMNTCGGFGQYIRVPSQWLVPKPETMTLRETMIYGTAGFTAGICLYELQKRDIAPDSGKILVTGATGGVGSCAVAMLAKAGYEVVASTGKAQARDYLTELGAAKIIDRGEVFDESGKPLLKGEYAGVVENVGGNTLSTAIRSTAPRGAICCLGNVESDKFECSVYPFLLRGVALIGIDSAERPMDVRLEIWRKIESQWRIDDPERIVKTECGLDELSAEIDSILRGAQIGRTIVKLWK